MNTDAFRSQLEEYSLSVFTCGDESIHGPAHWRRVDKAGMIICAETDADELVVRCFAYLHDAHRHDDGSDLDHGPRSADRLDQLPAHLDILSADQKRLLEHAIRHHTDGEVTDHPTIGACWDADRLDLGRVCVIPSRGFMSTTPGREIAHLGSISAYKQAHLPR